MTIINEIRITDVIDMAIAALLIYVLLVWFKQTRSAFALLGMVMVGLLYLIAQMFNLLLTTTMLQGFFAAVLVLIIVIFRHEIRQVFERVASRGYHGVLTRVKTGRGEHTATSIIVDTLSQFAAHRTGALIVLPGKMSLEGVLDGGTRVDGLVSEPLLHSIFDPHSAGHDGAVIIRDGRIEHIGCHLPLSREHGKLHGHGTRHAAALGLAEATDALCLVVSEERGTISAARFGELHRNLQRNDLSRILDDYYAEFGPTAEQRTLRELVRHNSREKLIAIGFSVGLWILFVHQARTEYRTYTVPVEIAHIPTGMELVRVDPLSVEITLGGARRAYYFFREDQIHLSVPAFNASVGWTSKSVSPRDISLPSGLSLRSIDPDEVRIRLEQIQHTTPTTGKKR